MVLHLESQNNSLNVIIRETFNLWFVLHLVLHLLEIVVFAFLGPKKRKTNNYIKFLVYNILKPIKITAKSNLYINLQIILLLLPYYIKCLRMYSLFHFIRCFINFYADFNVVKYFWIFKFYKFLHDRLN